MLTADIRAAREISRNLTFSMVPEEKKPEAGVVHGRSEDSTDKMMRFRSQQSLLPARATTTNTSTQRRQARNDETDEKPPRVSQLRPRGRSARTPRKAVRKVAQSQDQARAGHQHADATSAINSRPTLTRVAKESVQGTFLDQSEPTFTGTEYL